MVLSSLRERLWSHHPLMEDYLRLPFRRRARNLSRKKWLQRCRIGEYWFRMFSARRYEHLRRRSLLSYRLWLSRL